MKGTKITPQEFAYIYVSNRDKFIAIARSYVRDEFVAEDIVAESFANFWDNRERIELRGPLEAYILQSLKNRCLNHLRDKANRLKIQQNIHDDISRAMLTEINILEANQVSLLYRDDIVRIFRKLLDSMSDSARNIFLSSRFDELTYKEIALRYGITPRKVKREIQQTLEALRESLKDYLPVLLFLWVLPY